MQYEWDENKNRLNLEKHGLDFSLVEVIFNYLHITKIDNRKDYGEQRFLTMGTIGLYGRAVIVAHTLRNNKIRVISIRKANRREQAIMNKVKGERDV